MIALLLDLYDRGYDRPAWHGPNLKGAIRRVDEVVAGRRPGPGRHNVAEQVAHAAYWKYAVRRRLTGLKRGSFALSGSNWFPFDPPIARGDWRDLVALLQAEHIALRLAIADQDPTRLDEPPPGSKYSRRSTIHGIAMHDVYHAGQIQLVKALVGAGDPAEPGP